jgi:large subunit ribosomal protein L9
MKVILQEDVANLGRMGQITNVKEGYARNYLLPRGLVTVANEHNKAELAHKLAVLEKKRSAVLAEARKLASQIEKVSVTVSKQVGEDERIFGTVTTAELEHLLSEEGLKISKKQIRLEDEIKKVGVYSAEVHLHPEVAAKFKVWVVAQ